MKTEQFKVQSVVVGAGVVGLAVARQMALLGHDVLLIESGPRFGEGISSRNSEVIHAGLYYPEGSAKARLCVEGRELLYRYCQQKQVPVSQCGKWIVASGDEVQRLETLRQQAGRNGVILEQHSRSSIRAKLPDVLADEALFSARTGIVDSHGLMTSLLGDLERAGGQLVCHAPVQSIVSDSGGHLLTIGGKAPCQVKAANVVNAAGLGAVSLAAKWQGYPEDRLPTQYFARGVYFSYGGRHPFTSLIYPVPEPGGLGVHLTLDMAGQARFGPDVEWIDAPDFTVDPARVDAFAQGVRRWWPGLEPSRLQPAYAGVRPKLAGPEEGFSDFRIEGEQHHGITGAVQLFGIESPGLTASLAIAHEVSRSLLR